MFMCVPSADRMRVPMLGLSFVVQNMLDSERAAKLSVARELEETKARLKNLEKKSASEE